MDIGEIYFDICYLGAKLSKFMPGIKYHLHYIVTKSIQDIELHTMNGDDASGSLVVRYKIMLRRPSRYLHPSSFTAALTARIVHRHDTLRI